MKRLVDVSSYNRVTSLAAVDGAIFKATEGAEWSDPTFRANVILAIRQQRPWGAYHFGRVTSDPLYQARRFYGAVTAVAWPPLGFWLDHEASDNHSPLACSVWARQFMAELDRLVTARAAA